MGSASPALTSGSVVVPDAVVTWAEVAPLLPGHHVIQPAVGDRGHDVLPVVVYQGDAGHARLGPTVDQRVRPVARGGEGGLQDLLQGARGGVRDADRCPPASTGRPRPP